MKNIRNLFFSSVLIAFIGWCMYFLLTGNNDEIISPTTFVHIHYFRIAVGSNGGFLHSHHGC